MSKDNKAEHENNDQNSRTDAKSPTRRHLLLGAAMGATALSVAPSAEATGGSRGQRTRPVSVDPVYFPRRSRDHVRDVELFGKLAVITGASRGIGRATAEALIAKGVEVIGTSRDPGSVPNPPSFPLLPLDIADPISIQTFVALLATHPKFQQRGQLDILINNAGRYVLGQIAPFPPTNFETDFLAGRELGVRTNYFGHTILTTALLPFMQQTDYARIMFNVSVTSYLEGWTDPANSGLDTYYSMKGALRVYANHLDTTLRSAGSAIRVSTVNPYFIATPLADGPNPIFTQPVNPSNGYLSDFDPIFNEGLLLLRQLQSTGLPASLVGDAFVQLAELGDPPKNVVAASDQRVLALQGQNALIEGGYEAENLQSAMPFVPGRR